MAIARASSHRAVRNREDNPCSRWYRKDIDVDDGSGEFAVQRLKSPYFTPHIRSDDFSLEVGDPVFTIGSCFARNIELALMDRGFEVRSASGKLDALPVRDASVTALGATNKYNTHSILNELRWALEAEQTYPEACLVEIGEGTCLDPHANPTLVPADREETLRRRAIFTEVNRELRDCGLLVITLGLTEVWRDDEQEVFLNMTPTRAMLERYPDRYSFHVLDYEENLCNLEAIADLLRVHGRPDLRVVVTVSPVPLNATHSGEDVVTANTLSKTTLRAVAGKWASLHDNVMYFPSYEIVMNSDRDLAWARDRRHVRRKMVDHVMEVFLRNFLAA